MNNRKLTKPVRVGNITIGAGARIPVQSMCNTKTGDVGKTAEQIAKLEAAGCDIVRLAVPDKAAADAFGTLRQKTNLPLVADIHFDYRLALICAAGGADKIRINPGNIGKSDNVRQVAEACRAHHIPIRIGVNMGSIDAESEKKYGRTPLAMVESAFYHIGLLNQYDFDDIVVSLKASDVAKTVEAYRLMSARSGYPLHIGVTEAGTAYMGMIKSAVGIGSLLLSGIGDTIRVSLTADPTEEIKAAKGILRAAGYSDGGVEFVSCPTCGRCGIDLIGIASKVEMALAATDKPIKVAVMGCAVNGPGEAKDADIGIAGGDGCAVLFKKGAIIKKIDEADIVSVLLDEIGDM